MDSFLSGFSRSYTGNVGAGYTGNVSGTGTVGAANGQAVDVTQLKPGDTFQGEITSVNGEDVQIQLANGQYMVAKLARDVQVALGQVMNLQVQSNKDNHVVLKPVYDGNSQMLRVGEAALRAANMVVNEKNLQLVSKLIENGMSIDKNTLMTYNRLSLQNPQVDMSSIIKLNKLQLPVTEENARQLQNYQNLEHKILDGVRSAADELVKVYDSILGEGLQEGAVAHGASVTALENSSRFMEQVLVLLSDENVENSAAANPEQNVTMTNPDNGGNIVSGEGSADTGVPADALSEKAETVVSEKATENNTQKGDGQISGEMTENKLTDTVNKTADNAAAKQTQMTGISAAPKGTDTEPLKELVSQLKGESPQNVTGKVIAYISSGKAGIKNMKQLLLDTDIGRSLTAEQKAKIFSSEPFKSMLKDGLQRQWAITPEELSQEGKVEELYQRLMRESGQLSRLMNEAMQSGAQSANASQARAMGNISENVEFINQMNQMFNYVQLPLKLGNSQAHGDLYVYTNKKNMAHRDGMLTAFLHLDMEHLGSLDVSIVLQTEKNQITTKFYLDEDSISLVEEHIEELSARLEKKGYRCKNLVLEKDEDKTVLEHVEEQVAAGSAVLSYQTFDTRA